MNDVDHNATLKEAIIREASRYELESAVLSEAHRLHTYTWITIYMCLGLPNAILAALAGATALSQITHSEIIAGSLALIVSVLAGVTTFLNPGQISQSHKTVSLQYRIAQGKFRLFIVSAAAENDVNQLKVTLGKLLEDWTKIMDLEKDIHISSALERRARKVVLEKRRGSGEEVA